MKYDAKSLQQMKNVIPIPILTAYTCPIAHCLEKANIPAILVGDTVGMVEMGFASTREVTIDHMQYHIAAVRRGAPNTHIIGDLPLNTDKDPETALFNARLLINAGADSVKLEGPKYNVIHHLIENDIAVVGHTGLTPQTASDFKTVGTQAKEAERLYQEAISLEKASVFMLVLEHIPAILAKSITLKLRIPTIGIGAGPACDGQVLVINDAIGLGNYWPPFSKQYAHVGRTVREVAESFAREVKECKFPENMTVDSTLS